MSEANPTPARDLAPARDRSDPWYFDDPVAVDRLLASCDSCLGTPWHFGSRAKGKTGGMDCSALPEIVMFESGVVPKFKFERRKRDISRHVLNERMVNYFRGLDDDSQSAVLAAHFAELDANEIREFDFTSSDPIPVMPGDICILKTGKGLYHLFIMMRGTAAIHCAAPDGVTEATIDARNYREHLVAAFRARALPVVMSSEVETPVTIRERSEEVVP